MTILEDTLGIQKKMIDPVKEKVSEETVGETLKLSYNIGRK